MVSEAIVVGAVVFVVWSNMEVEVEVNMEVEVEVNGTTEFVF